MIPSGAFVPEMGLKNNQKRVFHPRSSALERLRLAKNPQVGRVGGLSLTPAVLVPGFLRLSLHLQVPGVLNPSPSVAHLLQAPHLPGSHSNIHQTSVGVRKD